jgi:hypothetical protein
MVKVDCQGTFARALNSGKSSRIKIPVHLGERRSMNSASAEENYYPFMVELIARTRGHSSLFSVDISFRKSHL